MIEQKGTLDRRTTAPPPPTIDNISVEERQLLGRYGVWLLVGRCTPTENTPIEILGRLLAMVFYWFHMTAYSYNGKQTIVFRFQQLKKDALLQVKRKVRWKS